MSDRLYLDHAATTPLLPAAADAVARGLAMWANPSSPHAQGRAARAALEDARAAIRDAYRWPGEVVFTSGASEAIAIALGRAQVARRLVMATEHDAVLRAAPDAPRLPVDRAGAPDLEALRDLPPQTLVAVQWCNSETGVRQPIGAIADIVHAAGGYLVVDAAQIPAGAPIDGADMVAVSAPNRGGPPGIGALLVRDPGLLMPAGGQERGYRGGTENVPGVLGFAAALMQAEDGDAMTALRTMLDAAVLQAGGIVVAGDAPRAPHIASYRMPGVSAAAQLIRFDMTGIAVSAGSACSSGSLRPSHVLSAMGWDDAAVAEVIRVSFGRDTTGAYIDRFIAAWTGIAAAARSRAA